MTDYNRAPADVIAQAVEAGELDRAEAGEILVARALRKLAKRKASVEDVSQDTSNSSGSVGFVGVD